MRRLAGIIMALMVALPGSAPAQEARLNAELSAESTLIGQPLTLKLTILFPTWMPKPPIWPEFDQPGLLVRLPERSTLPVRARVGAESWPGISRTYRMYPLAAGRFEIPVQTVTVTYADPGALDPVVVELPVGPFRFTATLPAVARGLDPVILASGLTLEQTIQAPDSPVPGDAITRIVTARIEGAPPVILPSLIPDPPDDGLKAYAHEPRIVETDAAGILSGTRSETVTYVVQTGGTAILPEISLSWFDIGNDRIATATLEAIQWEIPQAPVSAVPDPKRLIRLLVGGLAISGLLWLAAKRLWPLLKAGAMRLRERWRASERHAHRRVMQAINAQRLDLLLPALAHWTRFLDGTDAAVLAPLDTAVGAIGAARFGPTTREEPSGAAWRSVRTAYRHARAQVLRQRRTMRRRPPLPPLNPI